jgi:hypothetical protein
MMELSGKDGENGVRGRRVISSSVTMGAMISVNRLSCRRGAAKGLFLRQVTLQAAWPRRLLGDTQRFIRRPFVLAAAALLTALLSLRLLLSLAADTPGYHHHTSHHSLVVFPLSLHDPHTHLTPHLPYSPPPPPPPPPAANIFTTTQQYTIHYSCPYRPLSPEAIARLPCISLHP